MIKNAFNKDRALFVPFVMAGHPTIDLSIQAIMVLDQIGCDVIEIGVPFSDPIADGPINQRAAQIAINNGMTLRKVVEQVKIVRELGCKTPIILFSYLNPILQFGYVDFIQAAHAVGINGLLIVDLPPEEGIEFYTIATQNNMEIALLVSPTTDIARLQLYTKLNPSFIYYISRLGVTGVQKDLSKNLQHELQSLRKHLPNTKIVVGFGITTLQQTATVAKLADGVVIGSKLVATLEAYGITGFKALAQDFVQACANSHALIS